MLLLIILVGFIGPCAENSELNLFAHWFHIEELWKQENINANFLLWH